MAKLHVVYDPTDRLEVNNNMMEQTGIKVAIVPLADGLTQDELTEVICVLTSLLLEQVYPGTEA